MPRFQPGRPGNPKGRPKGARNLACEFMAQVTATADAPEGAAKLSKLQTAIKAQIDKAVAGDNRAIEAVLDRVAKLEARVGTGHTTTARPAFTSADREVIAAIHRRLTHEGLPP